MGKGAGLEVIRAVVHAGTLSCFSTEIGYVFSRAETL